MVLLINKDKVAAVLQVAIGYNASEFNVFIREAQDFDFKPLVCEEFYYDLIENREDDVWKKIIEGGDYQYNTRTYSFRGLEDVLSYFTYARFILKSNNVSTSHGFVTKKSPHSEPLSLDEKRNHYYKYKSEANLILEDVKKFIERNISDYPSWNSCNDNCSGSSRTGGFKTHVIK